MRIDHRWIPPFLIGMVFLSLATPAGLPMDEGLARISIPWEIPPAASGEPDDRGWTLPAGDYQVEFGWRGDKGDN